VAIEALRWRGDALELLDQRLLPERTLYVTCRSAAEVAHAIRDMVVRGAPAIGCAAAFGVALDRGAEAAFDVLARSRPTAVNLFWALERMRQATDYATEAIAILEEDIAANRAIGAHGATLVPDGARIMTYCNTGALATAGYGTALGVVRGAIEQGKRVSVIACETRPYLQGARLTAWECIQEGIPCTLVSDKMSGHRRRRDEVDLVAVGADRIAANGDVANKVGTYPLALAAARAGVPFVVAAPESTVDADTPAGDAIEIEERDPSEVAAGPAYNPAFDVTPHDLVTAVVTERRTVRLSEGDTL